MRLKASKDGTYRLLRRNPAFEAACDKKMIRVSPRELKWVMPGAIWSRKNDFQGQHCHLVGKGPSLDLLMEFPDTQPIFCINEAIVKVEELDMENLLFATQLDPTKRKEVYLPKRATMLIPARREPVYKSVPHIVCSPMEFGLIETCLSAVYALAIIRVLGFERVHLWAFDAITSGSIDYAKCVGSSPVRGGNPQRFLSHGTSTMNYAAKIGLTLVLTD